jgi:hypothetical protein
MIDLSQFDRETIATVSSIVGVFLGGFIATVIMCLFAARNSDRFYKKGCTDTEKLIRNQQVRDLRGSLHQP